jgi:glycosyltransferase involved in cell wall biosynthesis
MLTDWEYPCDEPFMSEVYSKRWQAAGHEIVWVMRPSEGQERMRKEKWNGANVWIPPSDAYSVLSSFKRRVFEEEEDHLKTIYEKEGPFDILQVRNDLSMAIEALRIAGADEDLVFRHSHLKAETLSVGYRQNNTEYNITGYLKGKAGKHLRNMLFNQMDLVLSISDAMAEYHRSHGVKTKIRSLPMGADTSLNPDEIDPSEFMSQFDLQQTPYILYAGSMNPIRELEFLFDVLCIVRRRFPDVKLVMVGGRDTQNRSRLKQIAEKKGVSDGVVFTGWVSDDLLNQAIRGSKVGLSALPPNFILRTNSPTKVLEYLNFKTPAIVNDTPDQRYVVNESGGGKITEYERTQFAEAVCELLNDREKRQRMGEKGREFIEQNRSYDRLFEDVENQYQNL